MPHYPVIPFLDIYPKDVKTRVQTKNWTALFTVAKILKQPKCSSVSTDKMVMVQWNVIQPKSSLYPGICSNMDKYQK